MEPTQRSRTLELPAILRALHQTRDEEPKILTDPIVSRLVDTKNERQWLKPLLDHPFARQWRAGFALRARYAEDCLAEGVRRGVRQYVVLGAGLDTFAYRQPAWAKSLQVYETDFPGTQEWKRGQLKTANIVEPVNVTFVPLDFERTAIQDALRTTGFDFDAVTLCSWMGVTQYLTCDALDATLRFALSLPRTSEIVFSIIVPQRDILGIEAEALALAEKRAAEIGEPWLTRLDARELAAKLRAMGFSQVVHLLPEEADMRYFSNRRDGLRARRGEQLMRAIV